ncbi:RagB/SusD family nutrient uptake outer membrane protein [Mariniphaga anaerophila]|uniref:RagB/SusD family nutrient uptake outer membrane protein n=1 Tax=Mariniphaga anaerophila TaxID=1484053 RepID=UPI0011148324|nr:RagB/SusD family nutrient uptake outer membrane protein [Mariniphaga anaerophila]
MVRVPSGTQDKVSVEKEILNERWKELFLELKRYPDLVRFHYGGTIDIYDQVPNLNGKDGYPLYFPVEQSVLDNNNLIEQTEGYQ